MNAISTCTRGNQFFFFCLLAMKMTLHKRKVQTQRMVWRFETSDVIPHGYEIMQSKIMNRFSWDRRSIERKISELKFPELKRFINLHWPRKLLKNCQLVGVTWRMDFFCLFCCMLTTLSSFFFEKNCLSEKFGRIRLQESDLIWSAGRPSTWQHCHLTLLEGNLTGEQRLISTECIEGLRGIDIIRKQKVISTGSDLNGEHRERLHRRAMISERKEWFQWRAMRWSYQKTDSNLINEQKVQSHQRE